MEKAMVLLPEEDLDIQPALTIKVSRRTERPVIFYHFDLVVL
jgi:hypothetical protein